MLAVHGKKFGGRVRLRDMFIGSHIELDDFVAAGLASPFALRLRAM